MNLITRIKNLWKLSAYEPRSAQHNWPSGAVTTTPYLQKNISTVEYKPATIVDLSAKDPFDDTAQ